MFQQALLARESKLSLAQFQNLTTENPARADIAHWTILMEKPRHRMSESRGRVVRDQTERAS